MSPYTEPPDDCPELTAELREGGAAACALAKHVRRMGADKATFPILVEDEKYEIVVTHIPVNLEP